MRLLKSLIMSVPPVIALGYLWTQTFTLSELGTSGGDSTFGLMVGLIVLPLVYLFIGMAIFLSLRPRRLQNGGLHWRTKVSFTMLALVQFLGTGWGWLLLARHEDAARWPLLWGMAVALLAACLPWVFFPRLRDPEPSVDGD